MVTEEPIVVSEPKELQVPEFNKKEVEGIAVNAVKDEIAAGNIATGIKIYKHTITATAYDAQSDERVTTIVLLNSNPLSYSRKHPDAIFDSYYISALIDNSGDNAKIFVPLLTITNDYESPQAYFYNMWGSVEYFVVYFESDTVTEL